MKNLYTRTRPYFISLLLTLLFLGSGGKGWGQTAQLLPYSFNPKLVDLTPAKGWTQSGIGTDYSDGTCDLKFDNTGDYAYLQIASAPATVSFYLKSNSASGYTYELFESVDGTTWGSTIKSITTGLVSTTGGSIFSQALSSTTRYIKWVYTTKTSGNIGMGTISITAATLPPTKLAITSVPSSVYAGTPFSVTVQSQDGTSTAAPVTQVTGISLANTGGGTIGGNTGSIANAANNAVLSSVTLNTPATGVTLTASTTSGMSLTTSATSSAFTVYSAIPTTLTTSVGASAITATGTTVSWTNGNGAGRIVVARLTSNTAVPPTLGTQYTPSTPGAFNGTTTTGSGNIVVYNGTGTSIPVTNLASATPYTYDVYEYNGSSPTISYSAKASSSSTSTLAVAPTTAASSVVAASIAQSTLTLNWTSGNGSNRIVVARLTSTSAVAPTQATTYTPTSAGSFTGTTATGTGNIVIYNGSAATVNVTNLTANTSYTFDVYEYNGSGVTAAYYTAGTSAPITTLALAAPGAPTIGTATAVNGTASVPFTQPASNGGSTITSYTATSSPGGFTGTLSQATSGTITVSGLTNGTAYTFTVTATNAIGTSSPSSPSNSVTPLLTYCTSTGPSSQGSDYFTNFTTTGGITNISNTSTYSSNGYGDFTAQVVSQVQGGTVNYSAISPGISNGSSFGIFIDWNQDGDFADANETVYASTTPQLTTNPSGSFSVPAGATLGNTRMRIVIKDATGAVSSCNTAQAASETEDYTFTVVLPCTPPTTQASAITASAPGTTQLTANWTAGNGDGTMIVLRPTAQVLTAPVSGNSYTANTDYASAGQINTNNRVVFRASGTGVTATGLTAAIQYTFTAYEYTSATNCYNLNSPLSASIYTLSTEPLAHSATFTATATGASSINLGFAAASTITNAAGYIILQKTGVTAPVSIPADATSYSVGNTIGVATVAAVITNTATTNVSITGLTGNTDYSFTIIPYNWNGSVTATYNYYTSATIPASTAKTSNITAPVISSPTATAIASTTATLGANVTNDGGDAVTVRGVVWSATSSNNDPLLLGTSVTDIPVTGTTGVYTASATALPVATQISYKGYATNGIGTTYTNVSTFTTLETAPTTAASSIIFNSFTTNSINLSWTNGNGANRIVVARLNATTKVGPSNGVGYTANSTSFIDGLNSTTGTGNIVIYNGTANTINVTDLAAGTAYAFDVYEYNGTSVTANYFTSTTGVKSTLSAEPTVQASGVTFSSVSPTGFTVNWTKGPGSDNSLVVVKDNGAVDSDPVDATSYSANAAFGTGTQLGTGNYVVYRATVSTVIVTGLTEGHTYHVAVYAYNGTAGSGLENYLITSPARGSQVAQTPTYYSKGSLDPGVLANWNSNRDGTSGSAPVSFTTNTAYFVIQNGHTMTTTLAFTLGTTGSKLQIENGGTLSAGHPITIASGATFRIDDGGKYIQTGGITMASTIFNGTEDFTTNSNFEYTLNPTAAAPPLNGYGNLTINVTTGSTAFGWGGANLTSVKGNLTILGTGSGTTRHAFTSSTNTTVTIGGDFNVTGGNFWLSSSTGTVVVNLGGNLVVNGGTLDIANSSGVGTINVSGNVTVSSGTLNEAGSTTTSKIVFNKSGTQTFTSGGTISNAVNFEVAAGSTTNLVTSTISGGGTVTVLSGGILQVGSTSASGAVAGNITATGGLILNTSSTVEYNGASAQFAATRAFSNITISNANGVSLLGDITVNGTLTVGSNKITTGSNKVILASGGSLSRTSGYIVGNLQKYVGTTSSQLDWPIGDATNYAPVSLTFNNPTGTGSVTVGQATGNHPNNATSKISSTKRVNRYYTITNSGVTFNTLDANFTYVGGDILGGANTNNFIVGRYSSSAWTYPTVGTKTGTSTQITGVTPSVSGISDFQIGENRCTLTATASNDGPKCEGEALGFTATPANGTSPYSYSWNGPITLAASQNPSIPNATTAATGDYTVTITDNLGCIATTATITATVNAKPSAPTAGNNGAVCEGTTLSLTASTISGATYSWTGPNSFTSASQNPTVSTSATTAMAGPYSVTATLAGCTSTAGSTTVTVNALPSAPTAGNNGPVCSGASLSLSASTISGATYSWTGPNSFTSSSQNPTVSTSATTAMAGTYNVTATIGSCTSAVGSTVVSVNSAPTAYAGPDHLVASPYTISESSATNADLITWSILGGPDTEATILPANDLHPVFTTSATGTFVLLLTVNGCSTSRTDTVNLYVVSSEPYEWSGTSNSPGNDHWDNPANWLAGNVPLSTSNVLIPAEKPRYPTILSATSCASIVIQSGASLCGNEYLTVTGTSTVERMITKDKWHLISVPNAVTYASTFVGDYLRTWDEVTAQWVEIKSASTLLSPKVGYRFWNASGTDKTYSFVGLLNQGTFSQPITYTAGSLNHNDGANLVGNPYPSYIDWSSFEGIYGAVYYWNGTAYDAYAGGNGQGSPYVPPMQGFFVVRPSTGGQSNFVVTNNNRVNYTPAKYYKSSSDVTANSLVLKTVGESYSDRLFVVFDPATTAGFDLPNDAYKFLAHTAGVSELYSFTGDSKLSIDVRPECTEIQLGFTNTKSGDYQIGLDRIADIPVVSLEDIKTGTFHDLLTGAYTFSYTAGESDKRFILHFGTTAVNEAQKVPATIYSYQRTVFVTLKGQDMGDIFIYNITGQLVASKRSAQGSNEIKLPNSGNYIVKVISKNSSIVRKVFIQQ